MQHEFTVTLPNQVWVIDITYIRTHEGWLYLTAVIDLYSRMVVGWAMNASKATELVLDALTMAVWRRRPTGPVMIHSDQGSQFGSDDFARWCKDNQLVPSISRRGNCWDNAVGHYWRRVYKTDRHTVGKGDRDLFESTHPFAWHGHNGNVFCVDFSAGGRWLERKAGTTLGHDFKLAALRWPERTLQFDDGMVQTTTGFGSRTETQS